jgi:hypothetical protein
MLTKANAIMLVATARTGRFTVSSSKLIVPRQRRTTSSRSKTLEALNRFERSGQPELLSRGMSTQDRGGRTRLEGIEMASASCKKEFRVLISTGHLGTAPTL